MNDITPGAGRQSVAIYLRGSSANRRWQRAECKNFAAAHYDGVPVELYEDGEHCAEFQDLALRFARFFRKLLTRPL